MQFSEPPVLPDYPAGPLFFSRKLQTWDRCIDSTLDYPKLDSFDLRLYGSFMRDRPLLLLKIHFSNFAKVIGRFLLLP